MNRPCRLLLAAASLAAVAPVTQAATVSLTPDKDATLYEEVSGDLANGAGEYFFAGRTAVMEIRRGLLSFNLSPIPRGSVIHSATLRLHMSRTNSQTFSVTLHRVTANWGEGSSDAGGQEGGGTASEAGDATWIHRFYDTQLWGNPGGDFLSVESAIRSVGDVGFYTWGSTPAMVADVQLWVDDPASNSGWLLRGNEFLFLFATAKRFDSRENATASMRPVLTVDFTPPPQEIPALSPWGWSLLILLVAVAALGKLRRQ